MPFSDGRSKQLDLLIARRLAAMEFPCFLKAIIMKHYLYLMTFVFFLLTGTASLFSQEQRPAYCDDLPVSYEKGASRQRPSLPKFSTVPVPEYKVQVAILRFTDPAEYPFHPSLIARYRPCEEVWVIESRESFTSKSQALQLRDELRKMGYNGAYLIEMVGYQ